MYTKDGFNLTNRQTTFGVSLDSQKVEFYKSEYFLRIIKPMFWEISTQNKQVMC